MSKRIRLSAAAALGGALVLLLANAPGWASGWEQRAFESPVGDKLVGLGVESSNEPDFVLAIACDGERGDRWRGVAVLQRPANRRQLENPVKGMTKRQRVDVSLDGGRAVSDTFEIGGSPRGGTVLWAPEPSKFARQLLDAEKTSPKASLTVTVYLANKKPLPITFPLAGLNADFPGLSKRCRNWQP